MPGHVLQVISDCAKLLLLEGVWFTTGSWHHVWFTNGAAGNRLETDLIWAEKGEVNGLLASRKCALHLLLC